MTTEIRKPLWLEGKDEKPGSRWIEPAPAAREKVDRAAMISPEMLETFLQRSPRKVLGIVMFDFAIIVLAAVLCEMFWSPLLYILVVMTIGARFVGIFSIGLHDGAHNLISSDRETNDRLAKLILAGSLGIVNFNHWRIQHFQHHRFANIEARHLERFNQAISKKPVWIRFILFYAQSLLLRKIDYDPERFRRSKIFKMSAWQRAGVVFVSITGIEVLALLLINFKLGTWLRRLTVLLLIAATAALAVSAIKYDFYPAQLFFLYWAIPLFTWGLFIKEFREMAEHFPCNDQRAPLFYTRDVLPTWFDSFFLITRGVNYHLTHHLFPGVPFFRLKKLQSYIAKSEAYLRSAHVTHGYHRALIEIITQRKVEA